MGSLYYSLQGLSVCFEVVQTKQTENRKQTSIYSSFFSIVCFIMDHLYCLDWRRNNGPFIKNTIFSLHFWLIFFLHNSYGRKTGWLCDKSLIIQSLFAFCSTPMLNFHFYFTSSCIPFANTFILLPCLLTIFLQCTFFSLLLTKWPSCQGGRYVFILSSVHSCT